MAKGRIARRVGLVAAGALTLLLAVAPAKADWYGHDDWRWREARAREWREREWREHEWRERHRAYYAPRPYYYGYRY